MTSVAQGLLNYFDTRESLITTLLLDITTKKQFTSKLQVKSRHSTCTENHLVCRRGNKANWLVFICIAVFSRYLGAFRSLLKFIKLSIQFLFPYSFSFPSFFFTQQCSMSGSHIWSRNPISYKKSCILSGSKPLLP